MLTFRVGLAGSAAGGMAMSQYLLDSSIPREQATAAARYYAQSAPADDVARVSADFAALIARGEMTRTEALDELIRSELRRPLATPAEPGIRHVAQVYSRLVAGGVMDYSEAADRLTSFIGRSTREWDAAEGQAHEFMEDGLTAVEKVETRIARTLDVAVARATHERNYVGAVPETRRDLHPKVAEVLGIDAGMVVSTKELAHLLSGQRADGADIPRKQKQRATETKNKVAFVDLTFSADKSLSVAWALAPTDAERAIVLQAHKDAVDTTMGYVASQLGHMRRGKAGSKGSEQGHVAWIGVDHHTARPVAEIARTDAQGSGYTELASVGRRGDPQIHTHTLLLATVVTDQGRVGSVDLDALAGRIKEFGGLYEANLATNLRRSNVEVVFDKHASSARLTAIPDGVRTKFSKRTQDGTEAAREYARAQGHDWDALTPERRSEIIKDSVHDRRKAKPNDGGSDIEAWKAEAAAIGYTHKSVLSGKPPPERSRDARLEMAREASLELVDEMLQRKAKLDSQELRVAAVRGLVTSGIDTAADIDAITKSYRERGVRQDGQDTALAWGADKPVRGKARVGVTTALHEAQERELVALAKAAHNDRSGALPASAIQAAVARRERMPLDAGGLRFGSDHGKAQRAVMDTFGTGGRFEVAIGVAGAGKTAIMSGLVDAWRADERTVYGTALAWRQADALAGAGVDRDKRIALDPLIKRIQDGKLAMDRNSVVIVDEIGLVGTRQLLDLLREQKRHGFSIVAVGDPRQAQAVSAGPVIDILRTALGEAAVPELLSTIRQRTARERETAGLFREGNAAAAIERKREDGTAILATGTYGDAVQRVATLWRERTEANPGAVITASAPTNADARLLSEAIREQRREMGQVAPDARTIRATDQNGNTYALPLAVGDKVRLFDRTHARFVDKNTRGLIGNNGSVLEVRGIDADGITLRTAAGREGHVAWASLKDKQNGRTRLSYGDVLTIDSAQGLTSAEHINAMPAGTQSVTGFKAYVAESRHTEQSWLVVGDGAERREVRTRRAVNDSRTITEADVWANVARNLSRQPEASSSLAFINEAVVIRRGSVRSMQAGMQRTEARIVEGLSPTRIRQRAQSIRVAAHERVQAFQRRVANVVRDAMTVLRPDTERRRARMRM